MSGQMNTVVAGDESGNHDEPHIRDRRITVRHIHALAYYHDHPEEMRAVEERRRALHDAAEADPDIITGPEDLSDV